MSEWVSEWWSIYFWVKNDFEAGKWRSPEGKKICWSKAKTDIDTEDVNLEVNTQR